MAYTEYIDYPTGLTIYAKAKPLDTGTWANGIIALTENGATGEYSSAAFVDGTSYSIYEQLGGSPASSDTKTGITVSPPSVTDISGLTSAISVLDGKVDAVDGKVDDVDTKVTTVDGKVTTVDGKVTTVDGKVDTAVTQSTNAASSAATATSQTSLASLKAGARAALNARYQNVGSATDQDDVLVVDIP